MKFTVHKSDFMRVLVPAMGTVSNKNTITAIEGVLIETLDNGRIQISTYDMNKGVRATLEAMAYHSYKLVRPAYYETALSERYMQDPQSKEVLDMIFGTLYFDFSSSCSNIFPGCVIRDNLRPILSGKKNTVASSTRSWQKSVDRHLKRYNEVLDGLKP